MVFEQFKESIKDCLSDRLGADYQLSFHSIHRNNGLVLDSLCIRPKGQSAAPAICLNSYYDDFCHGLPLEQIQDEILQEYHTHCYSSVSMPKDITDFSALRQNLIFRLIHTASNQDFLAAVPHIPFHDLSIVFFLLIDQNKSGQVSAPVTNAHMNCWHTDSSELYCIASENTPKLLPAQIHSMDSVLEYLISESTNMIFTRHLSQMLKEYPSISPMYILSNPTGLFGASCILYKNVLKNFANHLKADLIILPSSIHEVILMKNNSCSDYSSWSSLVSSINMEEVPPEDQLSNQVYLYSLEKDEISVISYSCEPVGQQNPL